MAIAQDRGKPAGAGQRSSAVQETSGGSDKECVNAFLRNAEELFATAREGGAEDCDIAVLVGPDGIHMVCGSDWGLEPLRRHHGAQAAYRVTRSGGSVALEGRSAGASCRLEAAKPARLLPGPRWPIPGYQTS